MPRTLKLTVAYDGTDFAGWQMQVRQRTVQAVIEAALAPIEGKRVVITAAGRTDAGVHAAGQVVSLSLDASIDNEQLQRALNATLPRDVRVMAVEEVPTGFNARFDARTKTYHYTIYCGAVVPPQLRHYVWHVPQPLDVDAMNTAAGMLIGRHDFAAFQAAGGDVVTSVRDVLVSKAALMPGRQSQVRYEISGSGFLRHMVRNIVGTLVDVGRGRRRPNDMHTILESRDRGRASATAPPQGLVLWAVEY